LFFGWVYTVFDIPNGLRKVYPIAFLNNARTRHMISLNVAGVCSPRNISQQRRDQFISRGKKVSRIYLLLIDLTIINVALSRSSFECQKRDDYQEAIRWFLDHFRQYG